MIYLIENSDINKHVIYVTALSGAIYITIFLNEYVKIFELHYVILNILENILKYIIVIVYYFLFITVVCVLY
jgi:hypothetical protein